MLLRQVVLRNFCQYTYLQWDLNVGLNMIVGPVGSGKSNAMRAIKGTITGDFGSRSKGGKIQDRTYGTTSKDDTTAQTTWDLVDGRSFTVIRNLTKTGEARLLLDGKEHLTGVEQDITQEITKLTGFQTSLFDTCMFIRQREIEKVFSLTPAARVTELSGMTDAAMATHAADVLRDFESQDRARLADYEPEMLSLAVAEFERVKSHKTIIRMQRTMTSKVSDVDRVNKLNDIVARHERIKTLKAQTKITCEELAELVKKYVTAAESFAAARDADVAATEEREAIVLQQKAAEAERERLFNIIGIKREMDELQKIVSKPLPKMEVSQPELPDGVDLESGPELRDRRSELARIVDMGKSKKCVTCGRPFSVTPEQVSEAESSIAEIDKKLGSMDDYLKAMKVWNVAREKHVRLREAAKTTRELSLDSYTKLSDKLPAYTNVTEESLADSNTKLSRITSQLLTANIAKKACTNAYEKAQATVKKLGEEKIRLESRIETLKGSQSEITPVDSAELLAATEELDKYAELKEQLENIKNEASVALREYRQAMVKLRAARIEKRRVEKIKPVYEKLRDARRVLQQLPGRTVAEIASRIEHDINDRLEDLGADFTLSVDTQLDFTVTRHGHSFPHTRMSGGQSCMAGLSFWMSIASVMGMSTIFMDEPIDGLDEEGKSMLPDILLRIDGACRRANKQLVIITHNRSLMHIGHQLRSRE